MQYVFLEMWLDYCCWQLYVNGTSVWFFLLYNENVHAVLLRITLTWFLTAKKDDCVIQVRLSMHLDIFLLLIFIKGFEPKSWKDPTVLRQTACQHWSAADSNIQTAADTRTDSKGDRQAGRQASALADASACRAGFLDDRGRQKGGIKLKVAAVAELQSCFLFFQQEVRSHQRLQVFFLRVFLKPNIKRAGQRWQRLHGDTSPPMGLSCILLIFHSFCL